MGDRFPFREASAEAEATPTPTHIQLPLRWSYFWVGISSQRLRSLLQCVDLGMAIGGWVAGGCAMTQYAWLGNVRQGRDGASY